MVRIFLLASAAMALATAAQAQSARDPYPLFIAPDGQPFRAGPGLPPPVEQWFHQVDANHDGVISHDEFMADAMAFFAVLDVDHDGVITGPENARYEQRVAPEITVGGPPAFSEAIDPAEYRNPNDDDQNRAAHHTVLPVEGAARFSFFNEPQPIRVADRDLNWQVTQAEWRTASERRYRQLAEGNNGGLTLDSLPPWPDPRVDARRHRPPPNFSHERLISRSGAPGG